MIRCVRARLPIAIVIGIGGMLSVAVVAACGSRTGLDDGTPSDASAESVFDVPPIPWPDAEPDVSRAECPDGGSAMVYLLAERELLETFDPTSGTVTSLSHFQCPTPSRPNSMAVDRQGRAWIGYEDSSLFWVDMTTFQCTATGFVPGQHGFGRFGMGFSTVGAGPAEQLFVADATYARVSLGLATIDLGTFVLDPVGPFEPSLGNAIELTGTGDGRLFAIAPNPSGTGSHIAEIDKTSAHVLGETPLPIGQADDSFAFAYWGGDFYAFFAPEEGPGPVLPTIISRWRPADGSLVTVGMTPDPVIGAGVSSCAPQ
jgi:hypothetical protein